MEDLPRLHQRDSIANANGLIEVMGDEDHRASLFGLQIQQQVLHVPADQGIEGGEGLIHQQDGGIERQGPG